MYKGFVYLIISENRLVITEQAIVDTDYHLLMNNNGGNRHYIREICNVFCLAYIYGTQHGKATSKEISNNVYEFQGALQ